MKEYANRQIQQTANSFSERRKLARQGKFCLSGHWYIYRTKQQAETNKWRITENYPFTKTNMNGKKLMRLS